MKTGDGRQRDLVRMATSTMTLAGDLVECVGHNDGGW